MRVSLKSLILNLDSLISNWSKQIRRKTGGGRTYLKHTFSLKRNRRRAYFAGLVIVIFGLFLGLVFSLNHSSEQRYMLSQRQIKLQKLNKVLQTTKSQKAATEAEVKAKSQHEAELQSQIDDLNAKLQAKRASQLAAARAVRTYPPVQPIRQTYQPVAPIVVAGCGDNFYANFIYMHESGCRTNAIGPNGPCGLGQALPCSKMGCSLYDYACQNAFFTGYCLSTYGSWANCYGFWVAHNWW